MSWLRAIHNIVDATSAMQIAPTIVMAASFAPIDRFANRFLIFDIPPASSVRRTTPVTGARLMVFRASH
jgi:hypothetical protein